MLDAFRIGFRGFGENPQGRENIAVATALVLLLNAFLILQTLGVAIPGLH